MRLLLILLLCSILPAVGQAQLLRDHDGDAFRALLRTGRLARINQRYDEAELALLEALGLRSADGRARSELAALFIDQHRDREVVLLLEHSVRSSSNTRRARASMLHSLGIAHQRLGETEDAATTWLESLDLRESPATDQRLRRLVQQESAVGLEHRVRYSPAQAQNVGPCEASVEHQQCELQERWRLDQVDYVWAVDHNEWERNEVLWARSGDQWYTLIAFEIWRNGMSGEYAWMDRNETQVVSTNGVEMFQAQIAEGEVDYDAEEAYRTDRFSTLVCDVESIGGCLSLSRGTSSTVGPGRCRFWNDCIEGRTLQTADQRPVLVDDLTPSPTLAVQFLGTRVRVRGQASHPALRSWIQTRDVVELLQGASIGSDSEPVLVTENASLRPPRNLETVGARLQAEVWMLIQQGRVLESPALLNAGPDARWSADLFQAEGAASITRAVLDMRRDGQVDEEWTYTMNAADATDTHIYRRIYDPNTGELGPVMVWVARSPSESWQTMPIPNDAITTHVE